MASCTWNTLCTQAYAIQRRVASDLYSNLFSTYNVCSFHRCAVDRALDVYTKVIKKHPAAVVLHAVNKQHRFMSYDGLFIQRKKDHYLRKLMRGLPLNKQRKRRAQKQLNPWLGPEATRRTRRGQEADRLQR